MVTQNRVTEGEMWATLDEYDEQTACYYDRYNPAIRMRIIGKGG